MKKTFTETDFRKIRRFLCIGAHCDDTEIRAGTVARRLIRQGAEGIEWTLIDCPWCGALEPGSEPRRKAADLIRLRAEENRKAAGVLGMKELRFFHLRAWHLYRAECELEDLREFRFDFPDFSSPEALEQTAGPAVYTGRPMSIFAARQAEFSREFREALEAAAPDAIFTHSMDDRHIEHYAVSTLVLEAVQASEKLRGTPVLMWHPGGAGSAMSYLPTHFIEVAGEDVDQATEAMRCYGSQFSRKILDSYVSGNSRAYGRLCGKEYAAAFTLAFRPGMSLAANPEQYILEEYRTSPEPSVIPL